MSDADKWQREYDERLAREKTEHEARLSEFAHMQAFREQQMVFAERNSVFVKREVEALERIAEALERVAFETERKS